MTIRAVILPAMPDLKEVVGRIEERLAALGLTAAGASKKAGLSSDAIRNLKRAVKEGKDAGASTMTINKLAPILETTTGWLITGGGRRGKVRLVGYVGAGAETHFYGDGQGPFEDDIDAPDIAGPRTVAVEVRGDSLGPMFERCLIFYDDVRDPPTEDMVGYMCVCGLADGRVLVKQLKRSKIDGLWTLYANVGEPIYDVALDWAAIVKDVRPRRI